MSISEPRPIRERQSELDSFLDEYFPEPTPVAEPGPNGHHKWEFSNDEIMELIAKAANGSKVMALWEGGFSQYPSQSEADLALCNHLVFYTRDPSQVDRLFRQFKLYRPKWDEKRGSQT